MDSYASACLSCRMPPRRTGVYGIMASGRGGDHLWGNHRLGPAGPATAAGVQQHQPSGLRGARPVCVEFSGLQGSLLTMINLGFSTAGFFSRWVSLSAPAHTQLCGIRGAGQEGSAAGDVLPDHRAGVDRLARHKRLRRRVSDSAWVRSGRIGPMGRSRVTRRDFRRGLFPLVLRAGHVRAPRGRR